jgi:hypothetical protein
MLLQWWRLLPPAERTKPIEFRLPFWARPPETMPTTRRWAAHAKASVIMHPFSGERRMNADEPCNLFGRS